MQMALATGLKPAFSTFSYGSLFRRQDRLRERNSITNSRSVCSDPSQQDDMDNSEYSNDVCDDASNDNHSHNDDRNKDTGNDCTCIDTFVLPFYKIDTLYL